MENKVLLAMSTCAAQPAFPSKCWGIVTKNTTLETLPCTPNFDLPRFFYTSFKAAILIDACI